MKAKTLANKIIKQHYGKFSLSKGSCRCMEICVENIGRMVYEQTQKHGWKYDEGCKHAVDVQLYKIGKAIAKHGNEE